MTELYQTAYQSRPPIIEGLLYAGAYILAGAPKIGKSFLVAQIAYHVSTGEALWGYEVHPGTVLYLALEDDFQRIQSRMFMMYGINDTDRLHFATAAGKIGNGLDEQLENFVREHPDTRLIIIDTMQKIREVGGEAYSYASDYEIISKLKQFADKHCICVLTVHHTRKQPAGDSFEMISGTTGLLGCADGSLLMQKKKGNYNINQIDPSYVPAPIDHKQVYGITFEQGRNELHIDDDFFSNIVTENKELTEQAKIDLAISMITLKYTQSNSVCYVKGGQAIGIGAGQQSRIHCTRLAGSKADNWWLRQSPQVLGLQFVDGIRRADRDNTIDLYIGEDYMDVLAEGEWQKFFKVKPAVFTREEKRAWLDTMKGVSLGSDAFFPFGDNIERAHKSGVQYIAQPGGSIRDDNVIEVCNKYGITMAFTGIRLFHH